MAVIAKPILSPSILPCSRQVLQRIGCALSLCMRGANPTITWLSRRYGREYWLILDNLTLALVPDEASEYEPLLVLDDKGMRSYLDPAVNY